MRRTVKAPEATNLLISGWSRSADARHRPWRSAWITAGKVGSVASIRVTVDLNETTVTVKVVDERIPELCYPVENIRYDIPAKDLFAEAERLLLDAAVEQLRYAAAQTITEVADHG